MLISPILSNAWNTFILMIDVQVPDTSGINHELQLMKKKAASHIEDFLSLELAYRTSDSNYSTSLKKE